MRQIVPLLAASAAALATPIIGKPEQISLSPSDNRGRADQNAVQAWWDGLPDARRLFSSIEEHIAALDEILAPTGDGCEDVDDGDSDSDSDSSTEEPEETGFHPPWRRPHGGCGGGGHGHCGNPDKTIYELIKESKHTTKFAELADEHDEIKQLLQDIEHNHTLFVPTDRAFERIPCHHRHHHDDDDDDDDDNDDDDGDHREHCPKPPKEFILSALKYHLAPGLYPLRRIRAHRTLPTELHPPALSDDANEHDYPQRLRVSTTPLLGRTRLNFHARLLASDIGAKNGVIHAVDTVLIPPPGQTTLVRLLPGHFSTLALALETTGLAEELEEHYHHHDDEKEKKEKKEREKRAGGATLFAPTNAAFARLGPRLNAFLFSEPGKKYLRALMRYHVVVNETLYSDAYYRGGRRPDEVEGEERWTGYRHVDLPSLLHGAPISVDIREWKGFVSLVVNGFVRVVVRDGVADDGVIQVVGRVLIPPHRHHDDEHRSGVDGEAEISVEELKARLEPYLEMPSGRDGMGDL